MTVFNLVRSAAALLAVWLVCAAPARAQEPAAANINLAKELIVLKGGNVMFEPIVPGVIETAKNVLLQSSPMYAKDLNEIAGQLRKEYDPKRDELLTQMARVYAQKFTEAELKELLVFYKSPLGKKMITDEPIVIDQGMSRIQNWASQFSDEMLARMRAEMRKRGHNL
jgi:hypothetical protein